MSTGNNIVSLGLTLRDIEEKSEIDFDTLRQALPVMLKQKNEILALDDLSPESRKIVVAGFGKFSKQLREIAVLLQRFYVDEKEGTLTIIGSDNVLDLT